MHYYGSLGILLCTLVWCTGMNAPSTTWFKNVWRTSDSLEFDVVFTGCTIPGEFLEKCTWFSFLRGKPNLYTSKPFCEPNQLLKSGKDWGTPFKSKILFQTKCGHSLQDCFRQGCVFLLCRTSIPLITSPTGWMNPERRQIPPWNYRQISWSPKAHTSWYTGDTRSEICSDTEWFLC